jgi:hypothetical protein
MDFSTEAIPMASDTPAADAKVENGRHGIDCDSVASKCLGDDFDRLVVYGLNSVSEIIPIGREGLPG